MKKNSKTTTRWSLKVRTHVKGGQAEGYPGQVGGFPGQGPSEGPSWCDIQEQTCFASGDTAACMHVANFCWPN